MALGVVKEAAAQFEVLKRLETRKQRLQAENW